MNRTQRIAAAAASALVMGVVAAGCGGSDDKGSGDENVTLRVNVFGNFGYEDLYKQFEADHPGVKIVETAEGDLGQYNTQLTQQIAAGSGAGDVVAIEEGQVVNFLQSRRQVRQPPGPRLRRAQGPVADLEVRQRATTADGETTIGLGTDVGGLAMCYRTRPVREGRPADRPRRGRRAVADVGRLHRHRREVPGRHRRRQGPLHRRGHQHLQLDPDAGRRRDLLRHATTSSSSTRNPAVKDAWDLASRDDRRRALREAAGRSPTSGTPASRTARSRRSPARPG